MQCKEQWKHYHGKFKKKQAQGIQNTNIMDSDWQLKRKLMRFLKQVSKCHYLFLSLLIGIRVLENFTLLCNKLLGTKPRDMIYNRTSVELSTFLETI